MNPVKGQILVEKGLRIQSSYGMSEMGPVCHVMPRDEDLASGDFHYCRLASVITPRFVPQDEPGVYEMQFLVSPRTLIAVDVP